MPEVRTGLDRLLRWLGGAAPDAGHRELLKELRSRRVGMVTNPSAVTADLTAAPDALHAAGVKLAAFFGPEHGVRGEIADGVPVAHGKDQRTGLPIWSLYGPSTRLTAEMLAGIDLMLFDIQDVGARFYTFSSTLSHIIEGCGKAGKKVVILDRPNPIGGTLEGPLLESRHASFVGLHPIPIRHGATVGETGRLWGRFLNAPEPAVITISGWKRSHLWRDTGLQWITPSPNMPSPETALLYPGLCLFEGTNVSEGRGTTGPFRWIGAPWIQAETLAERMNRHELPGVRFRPARFRPSASKHLGVSCEGVEIHILEPRSVRPVALGVALIAGIRSLWPREFEWRQAAGRFAVDRLAGTSALREVIDAGQSLSAITASWEAGCAEHRRRLREVALYE